mmetsp:Transcript_21796/g.36054  ORF Transcript_21796/g.36054 Transcript_21796/m.36054 type:complete len:298 (+) Transcript_21796:114-1007(+)|eukprot:CAMPEP_0184655418 /NCGR_PEP_ID=MMETSP0308-20130426/13025_1 /TAXON_ID=38269 /ORGANISM="Gloeochaete witrockiana, Strain SAG 46.84" /LENGTH=297 /DNA_ID=CAMNT_0027091865 /DNA_START=95 /DNA_END=988 /DNA_ORIENTATION=-
MATKARWGDVEETAEYGEEQDRMLPDRKEYTEETESGEPIRVVVEYTLNEKDEVVKTTTKKRTVKKVVKINRNVEARKNWRKFGAAEGAGPGPEKGVTGLADEVLLEMPSKGKPKDSEPLSELVAAGKSSVVNCRICGKQGDHWTLKCPYKDKMPPVSGSGLQEGGKKVPVGCEEPGKKPAGGSAGGSKYVPPSMREGAVRSEKTDSFKRTEDAWTIRVSNLSEDAKEADVQELFRTFGPIQRVYLARDRVTHQSKGFAFVNFQRREDAAKAIEKLEGYGYDHLILHVEWARPSGQQ